MDRSRVRRRRTARMAAAASATGAVVLVAVALYAAAHPQVGPLLNGETPHQVAAANWAAVLWPVLVAVLELVAAVAILRWSDRQSYVASGAVNVLVVGFGLTTPWWLVALGPPAVLLGIIGVVGLVASAVCWAISTPAPEAPPRWPTHHEVG